MKEAFDLNPKLEPYCALYGQVKSRSGFDKKNCPHSRNSVFGCTVERPPCKGQTRSLGQINPIIEKNKDPYFEALMMMQINRIMRNIIKPTH